MRIPPAPPMTILTSFLSSKTMIGDIDETGLLPGEMKFAGAGKSPSENAAGIEKSFISLLKIIPVLSDVTYDPKLKMI